VGTGDTSGNPSQPGTISDSLKQKAKAAFDEIENAKTILQSKITNAGDAEMASLHQDLDLKIQNLKQCLCDEDFRTVFEA
jgi:hypothetical protein